MIKQLALPFIGVALFIVVVGVLVKNPEKFGFRKNAVVSPTPSISQVTVGGKKVTVTLADSDEEQIKGLSGVSYLPSDSGMLFAYSTDKPSPRFWMKGMLIPLDIIWIANGKIVSIDKSVPVPNEATSDSNLQIYQSPVPVDYVLEVNSGFSSLNNIEVGDAVTIP
jgi:hypothetical protein